MVKLSLIFYMCKVNYQPKKYILRKGIPSRLLKFFLVFVETLFDEFVPILLFGYQAKVMMVRNQRLLCILSMRFELMEVRL